MKKAPHKLPIEIHDPKPEVPMCVDLSDQAVKQADPVLPVPPLPGSPTEL